MLCCAVISDVISDECCSVLCFCCRLASSWTPQCSAMLRSSSYPWSDACAFCHTNR